ncbi:bifunctional metallophosphatase/5'-nucleotidase [Fictibacillus phosphorivorans]|uniref:Bifunctional metallophosphatase/5'-nucleotidase n=1 Tax=Fictibacillus phosphorivorans TaxID=1221500 RepID=A0A161RRA1_9BACL|nr:5'-nucleotidase C-terminal domain-containing protein [Fictibacillus phosphorivorans]KZE63829.1 bifunctional metallophosphatase/5'-nucleotidase [Fictibacillus phosphorivorans]
MKKTLSALALSLALTPMGTAVHAEGNSFSKQSGPYLDVQLLGVNDFHGQIDITRKVANQSVGRADYLASYIKQREAENDNTLIVHAGDMVGASSPTSALLQDEPTVEIMNEMGFDVGTLGNHEFDEGVDEMMRLINGGSHEKTGDFEGANFPYVVANVVDKETKKPILPPYTIKKVKGVDIGFIGVVFSDTPDIVIPSGTAGVEFTDETEAINKAAKELKKKGVKAMVVLAHNPIDQASTGEVSGELVDMANNVDDEIDVMFGAHNHRNVNAVVDNKLLVQAYSYGTAFADVDLKIDRRTKDIVEKKAEVVTTFHNGITPDAKITEIIKRAEDQVAPIINEVVGKADKLLSGAEAYSGESELGNVIADSMTEQTGTDFAFMNPGGIRDVINPGEVTWGELFNVQPFGNDLVTMTLTGAQIKELFESQWSTGREKMLQISGLKATFDMSKPVGQKTVSIVKNDGTPIDMATEYTVTVNNFMAGGGDGYTVLLEGKNQTISVTDLDALVNYFKNRDSVTAEIEGRIVKINQ